MATRAQLIAALRQADAAGDHQGATRIAQMISAQPVAATPAPHDNLFQQGLGGIAESAAGLGQMATNALRLASPTNIIGRFADATDTLGGMIRTATGNGSAPPPKMNAMRIINSAVGGNPRVQAAINGVAPQPTTEMGRMARSVGQMVPNAFGGGAGLSARAARVVIPAVASEGARAAIQAAGGGKIAQTAAQVVGGGLGGAAPELLSNTGNAMKGVVLANNREPVAPNTAQLAQIAMEKHQIPLRSDQIAAAGGDRAAGIRDSNLVGSNKTFQASNTAQKQAFTTAVGKTFGASGPLTTDTMAAAKAKLSQGFQDHAASTGVAADPQLQSDLAKIQANAREIGLSDNEAGAIDKQIGKINDLGASAPGGVIPGKAYLGLTESGSPLDSIIQGRGALSTQGQAIKTALSDAAARAGGPEAQARLADLRAQWANMKTVEPLAEKAGPEGLISPALLQGRVNATFDNAAYGSGGDLKELGDIGQTFLKEPGDSQTTARLLDRVKGPAAYAAMGADALSALHDPGTALAGAAALAGGVAANKGFNWLKAARSNNPAATNALLGGGDVPLSITSLTPQNALAPALIASAVAGPSSAQDQQ